MIQTASSFEVT